MMGFINTLDSYNFHVKSDIIKKTHSMKLKIPKFLQTKITAFLLVAATSGVVFNLAQGESDINSSYPISAQRTIMEIGDNGMTAPVMPMQNNSTTYLLTALVFGGVAVLAFFAYRSNPSQKDSNSSNNENQKL